jgi:hypothetical protein
MAPRSITYCLMCHPLKLQHCVCSPFEIRVDSFVGMPALVYPVKDGFEGKVEEDKKTANDEDNGHAEDVEGVVERTGDFLETPLNNSPAIQDSNSI